MIKTVVLGTHKGTIELLQRRVGGILKDISKVEACWFEDLDKTNADIYVSYAYGVRVEQIEKKFKSSDKKVIGAELTLIPAGVRLLNSVENGSRVGVLSEHLKCANHFLSSIIRSGVVDYNFIAGPIDQMNKMDVDVFVIPEELIDLINKKDAQNKKMLQIPRTITPMCAAQIINAALQINK